MHITFCVVLAALDACVLLLLVTAGLNWVITACECRVILVSDDVVQLTTFVDSTVCSQIAYTGHPVPLLF